MYILLVRRHTDYKIIHIHLTQSNRQTYHQRGKKYIPKSIKINSLKMQWNQYEIHFYFFHFIFGSPLFFCLCFRNACTTTSIAYTTAMVPCRFIFMSIPNLIFWIAAEPAQKWPEFKLIRKTFAFFILGVLPKTDIIGGYKSLLVCKKKLMGCQYYVVFNLLYYTRLKSILKSYTVYWLWNFHHERYSILWKLNKIISFLHV